MKNQLSSDPVRVQLTQFIAKISAMSQPGVSLRRFQAHLNELLSIHDGNAFQTDHCTRIATLGSSSRDEEELCQNVLVVLEAAPDWKRESEALRSILHEIQDHTEVQYALHPTDDNTASIIDFSSTPKARVVAFYLPQYHPIPENEIGRAHV